MTVTERLSGAVSVASVMMRVVAASGAVAHDILDRFSGVIKNDKQSVLAGKVAAFAIGIIAIILATLFGL